MAARAKRFFSSMDVRLKKIFCRFGIPVKESGGETDVVVNKKIFLKIFFRIRRRSLVQNDLVSGLCHEKKIIFLFPHAYYIHILFQFFLVNCMIVKIFLKII